ncbi:MAG: aldo/keto reductase, partial [Chloroflexota bacterium]
ETPVAETVSALEGLKKAGKIRQYGLGHLPFERVQEYSRTGKPFSILMELSAVERAARKDLLPHCQEAGLAAIAFSVTGRGLLTGRFAGGKAFEKGDIRNIDPLFQRERFQSGLRIARRLAETGLKYGKTPAQVAAAWVLAQPGVTCALTGPSSVEHLEENLGGSGWRIDNEEMASLEAFLCREQAALENQQRASVAQILSGALPVEPAQAFTDLIYALETALITGMVAEKEAMPAFYELFELRNGLDNLASSDKLKAAQAQLNRLILPASEV